MDEWIGKDRFDLRELVIDKLQQLGCYEGKNENHAMRVALCSRSGDVIEPLIQPQWYIRCDELAQVSRKQVEDGTMQIHPSGHTQDWYRWLDNIQDWCISRQLWWGHEIPAYQVKLIGMENKDDLWVVAQDEASAHDQVKALFEKNSISKDSDYKLVKDEDVLDTWFSSGLLPLSALGWTGKSDEPIPDRYPLQVMEPVMTFCSFGWPVWLCFPIILPRDLLLKTYSCMQWSEMLKVAKCQSHLAT